jgi:RNA polymerase sigma-70 factor (ECF subfamily)
MDSVPEGPLREGGAHGRVRAREIGIAVRDCLVRLAPSRCLAVTLYLQGHTAPETSRILGWTPRRTENLIFRGMADLRRCLVRKGVTP